MASKRTPEDLAAMRSRGGKKGGAATIAKLTPEQLAEWVQKLNAARLAKQRKLRYRGESLWGPPPPDIAVLGGKARMAEQTAGMTPEERETFFRQRGETGGKASGQARRPESDEVKRLREDTKKLVAEMRAREQAERDGARAGFDANDGGSSSDRIQPTRKPPARKRRARRPDASQEGFATSPVELPRQGLPTLPVEVQPPADAAAIADTRAAQAIIDDARRDLRIKLPRSGRRSDPGCYCKLLRTMRPNPTSGFDFIGKIFPSGKIVTERELRPDNSWPAVPHVLESAGTGADGPLRHGSKGNPTSFLLWRLVGVKWKEVARVQAAGLGWCKLMAPAVDAALAQPVVSEETVGVMANRMMKLFDKVSSWLTPENRRLLIGMLHDELAGRIGSGTY